MHAQPAFGLLMNIAHVTHYNLRPPAQTLSAIPNTGLEQMPFSHMGGRHPRYQRDQHDGRRVATDPKPEAMFFVADEESGFARTARARPQGRPPRRPMPVRFF